jgi:hypothetical protein
VLRDDPRKHVEVERIPDDLKAFVFRCLAKDPADRYQTARDLVLDLRSFQAEQLRQASERVTFRSEPPWKHRRPRMLLRAAGGIVLFALGLLAGSCWERSRQDLAARPATASAP